MLQQFGPAPPPLADKITPEHVSKILELEGQRLADARSDRTEERRATLHLAIAASIFVLVLVGMLIFSGNEALTERLVLSLASLVAGAIGGYGYALQKGS